MPLLRVLILLLVFAGCAPAADTTLSSVESEMERADRLVNTVPLSELMGPLAPIALSPFFGLTCLSGAAMLVEQGVLPENRFLSSSSALQHPKVFAVLLVLTLLTSVPRLAKVSKFFAAAMDQLETWSSLVVFLVMVYFAGSAAAPAAPGEATLYTAGVFSFTADTLIALAIIFNIIVINSVKFFCEVCILISPFPAVDAFFEAANKIAVGLLIAVYAFSPLAATVLNVLIFLVCLAVFNAVRRRIRYFRMILFGFIGRELRLRDHVPRTGLDVQCAIAVFPRQAIGPVKKWTHGWLAATGEGRMFVQPRLLGESRVVPLEGQGTLREGLLAHRVDIGGQAFDCSRRYRKSLAEIAGRFELEPVDTEPVSGWQAIRKNGLALLRT